jgi:hypothetical protein
LLSGEELEGETVQLRCKLWVIFKELVVFEAKAFRLGENSVVLLVEFLDGVELIVRRQKLPAFNAQNTGDDQSLRCDAPE